MGGIEGEPRILEPVKRERLTLIDLLTGGLHRILPETAVPSGALYLYRPSK